jgi:hypothetical protein
VVDVVVGSCDQCPLKSNRKIFNAVLAPLIMATALVLASWGWRTHAGHAEQENHLTTHDGEIGTLLRESDRILAKLDEILRELRGRK